jgi:hypothetical protein
MIHRLSTLALCASLLALTVTGLAVTGSILTGCTAVQRIPDRQASSKAYLRLDVEPPSTKIFIDAEYQGVVEGWVHQTVPVEAGQRRLELRADGFITRRFDVEFAPGEEVTMSVDMERVLEDDLD